MATRVTPHVRKLIIEFPDDPRRGEVSRFCSEHGVSVASFYRIRALAAEQGPETAAVALSTAAKTQSHHTTEMMEVYALQIRAELAGRGWDAGPLSVAAEMRKRGVVPPSRATLARIFTRHGVVVPQPEKKPRSSYHRFRYPDPNGCWQLDGFAYTLDTGVSYCILQVEDDHSRFILASLVARRETSDAAIAVVTIAITRHGAPAYFLTDNGLAFNSSRRGSESRLEVLLKKQGVQPITGRPGHPTTQGKNERLHQTLQKFLDVHRPITTLKRLRKLVDEFEEYYNTHRPHQGLDDPDQTPAQAYHATPKAVPAPGPITTPTPVRTWTIPQKHSPRHIPQGSSPMPGTTMREADRKVGVPGNITICNVRIYVGSHLIGTTLHVQFDERTITVIDPDGVILGIVTRPEPQKGTTFRYSLAPYHSGTHGQPGKQSLTSAETPPQHGETQTSHKR